MLEVKRFEFSKFVVRYYGTDSFRTKRFVLSAEIFVSSCLVIHLP